MMNSVVLLPPENFAIFENQGVTTILLLLLLLLLLLVYVIGLHAVQL